MPFDCGPKQLKLKRDGIRMRTRGGLTTLFWKDRQVVYMLTNMDPIPGNFCDESNSPMKPHIVEHYNLHLGYVDNSDRMVSSYSMSQHIFKWTTKLFVHLLDLTVLNSWILLSSCGAKYTHQEFCLIVVRNFIEEAGKCQDLPTSRLVGRPSVAATNVV